MSINCGDFVRPNNPGPGLPQGSVWRVVCTAGALKLEPENDIALRARDMALGHRFSQHNFDKVVLCCGKWVCVRDAVPLRDPYSFLGDVRTGRMSSACPSPQNMPKVKPEAAWEIDYVAFAAAAAEQASNAAAAIDRLREAARKLEAELQQELRAAKAAKAKADKEAAAPSAQQTPASPLTSSSCSRWPVATATASSSPA